MTRHPGREEEPPGMRVITMSGNGGTEVHLDVLKRGCLLEVDLGSCIMANVRRKP